MAFGPRFHPYMGCGGGGGRHFGRHSATAAAADASDNKARITEIENAYVIQMDVPGVKLEALTVEEKNGEIEIVAIRTHPVTFDVIDTYQDVLYLNPYKVDFTQVDAKLHQGVLTIRIPKKNNLNLDKIKIVTTPVPSDENVLVTADIPGVTPNDLELKIHDDELLLTAIRRVPTSMSHKKEQGGEEEDNEEDDDNHNNVWMIRRHFDLSPRANLAGVRGYLTDGVFTLATPPSSSSSDMDTSDNNDSSFVRTIVVFPALEGLHLDGESEEKNDKAMATEPVEVTGVASATAAATTTTTTTMEDDNETKGSWENVVHNNEEEDTKMPAKK